MLDFKFKLIVPSARSISSILILLAFNFELKVNYPTGMTIFSVLNPDYYRHYVALMYTKVKFGHHQI